jgi:TRAP-type mannitol/chloroaromatic compound transport system permease small subunit
VIKYKKSLKELKMKAIDSLTDFFGKVSSYLVLVLSLLVVYDALGRYLFHEGSVALQELEWHIFDVVFLVGLSWALKVDEHVRVDIFYSRFSPKTKAFVNLVSMLFLIIPFSIMIVYTSSNFIYLSFLQDEISSDPGGLKYRYVIKGFIAFGFVLLALQGVSEAFKNLKILRGQK